MRRALVPPVLAVLAGVAACGSAQRKAAAPATVGQPPESDAAGGAPDVMNDPHGQIEKLSAQIDEQSGTLGLSPPPSVATTGPAERMAKVPLSTDETCKPAKNDKCDGSCKISDSICGNASKICELATQLDDSWSANKCAGAKKSCDAAHENCCTCE